MDIKSLTPSAVYPAIQYLSTDHTHYITLQDYHSGIIPQVLSILRHQITMNSLLIVVTHSGIVFHDVTDKAFG